MIFGRMSESGKMINPQVAGLAPKYDDPNIYMLGHLAPVPASTGWTDGDLEIQYRSASWTVPLSEPEYRKVVAYIRKLQAITYSDLLQAVLNSVLGDHDEALDLLEKILPHSTAYQRVWFDNESDFDPIQGYPRFRKIFAAFAEPPVPNSAG
jgi:hypothetical protein